MFAVAILCPATQTHLHRARAKALQVVQDPGVGVYPGSCITAFWMKIAMQVHKFYDRQDVARRSQARCCL